MLNYYQEDNDDYGFMLLVTLKRKYKGGGRQG
jgi:hypothetical protein